MGCAFDNKAGKVLSINFWLAYFVNCYQANKSKNITLDGIFPCPSKVLVAVVFGIFGMYLTMASGIKHQIILSNAG